MAVELRWAIHSALELLLLLMVEMKHQRVLSAGYEDAIACAKENNLNIPMMD
jgi:urocanate hydratase